MTTDNSDSSQHTDITLSEAQRLVDRWLTTTGRSYHSVLTNTAILAEETGEVARCTARLYGDQVAKPGDNIDLADELADLLWVTIALANQTGINLTEALRRNLAKKNARDANRFTGSRPSTEDARQAGDARHCPREGE